MKRWLSVVAALVVGVGVLTWSPSGGAHGNGRHYVVKPGDTVSVAGIDWNCAYGYAGASKGKLGERVFICFRESTQRAVRVDVTAERISVLGRPPRLAVLYSRARNP